MVPVGKETDVQALVTAVMNGVATEKQQGVLLKALQINVSASLCANLSGLGAMAGAYANLVGQMQELYIEKTKESLVDMDRAELFEEINQLSDFTIKVLDLQRKVVQGKNLFPEELLSETDKRVLAILKGITNDEDREKAISILEQNFASVNVRSDEPIQTEVVVGESEEKPAAGEREVNTDDF